MNLSQDLPREIVDLGVLAGLLIDHGDSLEINLDWFENPLASGTPSLANATTRFNRVVSLIGDMLDPAAGSPPQVFPGARWYVLPISDSNTATPLCIVSSPATATSGEMGLGLLLSVPTDKLAVEVYVYMPVVTYDTTDASAGAEFVTGRTAHPCQAGFRVTTANAAPFVSGDVRFSAVSASFNIYLDPTAYEDSSLPSPFTLTFENLQAPAGTPSTYHALADLLDTNVVAWLGDVLAQGSDWLGMLYDDFPVSAGTLLAAIGVVTLADDGSYHVDADEISALLELSAADLALHTLLNLLRELSGGPEPLAIIELPGGGLYIDTRRYDETSLAYGLRLAMVIPLSFGGTADTGPTRTVTISLGSWLTGEEDRNSWLLRATGQTNPRSVPPRGVGLLLLRQDNALDISVVPTLTACSIGVDVAGDGNAPLINIEGYTLHGIELRAFLDSSDWSFGFATRIDGVGFPLGPSFGSAVSGSKTNPVATGLVSGPANGGSGGNGGGSGGSGGDQSQVNPAFSLSAAYVNGHTPVVQLYDKNDAPSSTVVIPIQRALGPLQCDSLGIGWVSKADPTNDLLSLLFTGAISVGPLNVDLVGLTIDVPVRSPSDFSQYAIDLHGLGMAFTAGQVELSAALVKLDPDPHATPPRDYIEYDGEALLKAGTFALIAVGSYAYVPASSGQGQGLRQGQGEGGYASLFLFGVLDAPLGGPAFFYVTGLAAGFGYNRRLILPDQSSVPQFPLVAAASDPAALGAQPKEGGGWTMPDPATALAHLDQSVPPERGEYWFAAGVRFTSFDLIYSTVLLTVEFGNELEIALLGLSSISLPPPAPGASTIVRYAYGELGIEVTVRPLDGVLTATAILTPNSFVIDPACKLTGGFALYLWFGDRQHQPHSGEFVLTLGGYHPAFAPPPYYPQVPRLGFSWPMPGGVTIDGGAYFALTPSAVMAGASLNVVYASGALRAWFNARMDAIVRWAPFHYLVTISVTLGASYRIHVLFITKTIKVELDADMMLWGPPTGGRVRVNWSIISFTVSFGADQSDGPPPLAWTTGDGSGFAQTLLPHDSTPAKSATAGARAAAGDAPQPAGVYTITVNDGLIRQLTQGPSTIWVVRPNHFVFSAVTAIPATLIAITPAAHASPDTQTQFPATQYAPDGANYFVCIRPMQATLSASVFSITVTSIDTGEVVDLAGTFTFDLVLARVPAAKWGRPVPAGQNPEPNALLDGRLLGLARITPKTPVLTPTGDAVLTIDIDTAYTYDVVDGVAPYTPDHLPLDPDEQPDAPIPVVDPQALARIHDTLMDESVIEARAGVLAALRMYNVDPGPDANGPLATLAARPGSYLTGTPLIWPALPGDTTHG